MRCVIITLAITLDLERIIIIPKNYHDELDKLSPKHVKINNLIDT